MLQYNPTVSGSLTITGSLTVTNGVIGTVSGVDVQIFSSSINQVITGIQGSTGSSDEKFNTLSSVTSSALTRLTNIESKSASVDISISNINTFTSSNANQSLNAATSSYSKLSGGNTFTGTQIVSASMYVQGDLIVLGTSSIQYISASSVSIGTNIVQLNTSQPAVRFAGISVQDSGSAQGVTGSIFWDGCCNKWIYSNPSGVGYSGGMLISGPRNTGSIGNEVGLTCNYLATSIGSDHISSSAIYHDPSTTCILTTLNTNNINLLNGNQFRLYNTGNGDYGNLTFATATGFTFDKIITINSTTYVPLRINSTYGQVGLDFQLNGTGFAGVGSANNFTSDAGICPTDLGFGTNGSATGKIVFATGAGYSTRMVVNASGCVGINTCCPKDLLEVYGSTNNGINICASDQPRLGFFAGGASANNKIWDFIPQSNNTFIARTVNDAKNSAATWLSVTRNGIDISNICFPQTLSTITIMGCVGFGIAANSDGQVRLAVDRQLRVEGASTSDTVALGIGGTGVFSIDAPGVGRGRFVVKDSGYVGIGITSPTAQLHICSCYSQTPLVVQGGGNGNVPIACFMSGVNQIAILDDNANLIIGTSSFATRVTCTSYGLVTSGKIGVGTPRPAVSLHVVNASPRVDIGTTDSYSTACSIYLAQSGNYATIEHYNYSAGYGMPLILNPSGAPGRGNVGIQTTTPTLKLSVLDTGCTVSLGIPTFQYQAKGIEVYNACSGVTDNVIGYWISTGPHKAGIASGRTNAASTWEVDLRFYTHPTTVGSLDSTCENMRLYGDGSLVTRGGASSPGLYSDINLKENLSIIPSALNKIQCINGYTFDWKDTAPTRSNPDLLNIIHDAGLIAQEVESILPDIVRENSLSCIKMLNYNGVIALLVEGMKEQQCTINLLKSCIGIS